MPNRLLQESSPYLLQHAHNPVDWYPWGEEALNRARKENKPILVSIGYAACHWCHVMERESFEDEKTAELMNEHFINIKIDREERPDLDHIYMDAVQAMTGAGGWPMNVFLTPDTKPFYGGTYFPPKPAYNRPSWKDVLTGVQKAFHEKRHEIDAQAENLTEHLVKANAFGLQKLDSTDVFTPGRNKEAFQNIMKAADKTWGGFGNAPKFPQTFSIQYLLRYYHLTGEKEALDQALLSLDKMIDGGIYDQAGGGFARYSTDTEWLAPHFEKMLYDNALLVSVMSEAYQLTGLDKYRKTIHETMQFLQREMLHPDQAFYSALDADSEGVEGKFYVWDLDEVEELLGADAALFCEFFDITRQGNWEHKNILRVRKPIGEFAKEKKLEPGFLIDVLEKGKKKLLAAREKRVRPLLDDKILLGWNALMNTATSKAFAATGEEDYRRLAIGNMKFLMQHFRSKTGGSFYHTWKNGQAKYPAFLDDHAFLIEALLHLQEITTDTGWLVEANQVCELVIKNFSEEETGFFYYTRSDQQDVIVRKKEVYDGAVPSGNSVMAHVLHKLSILVDKPAWGQRSSSLLEALGQAIFRYPTTFGNWANLVLEKTTGTNEIAITGPGYQDLHREMLRIYIPHRVLMGGSEPLNAYPLLANKRSPERASIWLCRNYTCQAPVFSTNELISLINRAPEQ